MKKLIILISSLAIISLTSCSKSKILETKPVIPKKTVIENNTNNKVENNEEHLEEKIIIGDSSNTENVEKIESVETVEPNKPIEANKTIVASNPSENNQPNPEKIINEDPPMENIIIPSNEEDAINNKTDNTIYFFISNSNADGFDIIETNVGTSDLKSVLNLAVNNYSLGSIPQGTVVNSAYVENGIAYINLNEFFAVDSQSGTSSYTYTKIYSIVNLAIYNKVFGVDKVVLSIENGITCIGPAIIPEFYTAKLFNKGTY